MKIIYGQQLVKRVRELADNVQKRLWVASPYLSSWAQIRKIIGRNWIDRNEQIKTRFGVRLLTDIAGGKFINPETLERFRKYGEVRTKSGLHAKIYIIDDSAIITSANLTGTAFSKRYEVGILLDSKRETQQIVDLFEDWWQKKVKEIPEDWEPESDRRETRREREEPFEAELEQLWSLPPDPGDP
ncbi:MAG: phospholipase D-like domain-containing protein, partial [candidate division WOR-3 bacterium]